MVVSTLYPSVKLHQRDPAGQARQGYPSSMEGSGTLGKAELTLVGRAHRREGRAKPRQGTVHPCSHDPGVWFWAEIT